MRRKLSSRFSCNPTDCPWVNPGSSRMVRTQVSSATYCQMNGIMAVPEISVLSENVRAELGEGPHWDTTTQKLLWVDSFDHSVHVLDVEKGEV